MNQEQEAKEIVDAHIAAAQAMRALRQNPTPPARRARQATSGSPAPARPRLTRLTQAVRGHCRKPRLITALDPRTHIRIKHNLERLERRAKLIELGLIPKTAAVEQVMQNGGDAAADPALGPVAIQFR